MALSHYNTQGGVGSKEDLHNKWVRKLCKIFKNPHTDSLLHQDPEVFSLPGKLSILDVISSTKNDKDFDPEGGTSGGSQTLTPNPKMKFKVNPAKWEGVGDSNPSMLNIPMISPMTGTEGQASNDTSIQPGTINAPTPVSLPMIYLMLLLPSHHQSYHQIVHNLQILSQVKSYKNAKPGKSVKSIHSIILERGTVLKTMDKIATCFEGDGDENVNQRDISS